MEEYLEQLWIQEWMTNNSSYQDLTFSFIQPFLFYLFCLIFLHFLFFSFFSLSYSCLWLIDFINHTKTSGSSPGHRHLESWNRDVDMERNWRQLGFICQSTNNLVKGFCPWNLNSHFRNNFVFIPSLLWLMLMETRIQSGVGKTVHRGQIVHSTCRLFFLGSCSHLMQPLQCWLKWIRPGNQLTYLGHNPRNNQVLWCSAAA